MHRSISAAAPTAARHQAPVSDSFRGAVSIVEIGKTEQQMTELMRADADLAIFRYRQIAVDLRAIDCESAAGEGPFVRPNIIGAAGHLGTWSGMNHDEGIDVSVSIVVVGGEIDRRIGSERRVARHSLRIRRRHAETRPAVRIRLQALRQAERTDDLALDVDQAIGYLFIVLPHALGWNHALRGKEILEVFPGLLHRPIGEIGQHHDDLKRPARRCSFGGRGAHDAGRGAEREFLRRNDDSVVEAQYCALAGRERERAWNRPGISQRPDRSFYSVPKLRMRGNSAPISVVARTSGTIDASQIVQEKAVRHDRLQIRRLSTWATIEYSRIG